MMDEDKLLDRIRRRIGLTPQPASIKKDIVWLVVIGLTLALGVLTVVTRG
jgi:hypothetical protein